ncbi:hypothetical protein COLO4_12982 [Corchorus olitorius]|uniref:Zinc finger CCCH domain-containing protein 40 n=1 Tax=Corchorus olitorius TaxID=93759 RepID=A0A1R3JYV2_9ROSI|nr:hypothetical protein COLO4_12982 [Corchorus olitorius]
MKLESKQYYCSLYVSDIIPCDGKRNFQDCDLRDKLDRKLSPDRRNSLGGDDQWVSRGHSSLRSIEKSDRNQKKKRCLDGQTDFSENVKTSDEIEDLVIEGRAVSSTPKSILQDQLKEMHLKIKPLMNRQLELDRLIEEKIQEAGSFTSQIEELESQLEKEKEKCERITSRIKKLVKAHKHCTYFEDEVKRSEVRLQKFVEQLGLNISGIGGDEENSNIDIVSDGETTGCHMFDPQTEIRSKSSLSKKRLHANQDIAEEPIPNGKQRQEETTTRLRKRSRWSEHPAQSNINKENGSLNNRDSSNLSLGSDEKLRREKKVSVGTPTADKLKSAHAGLSLPSTSMAAHVVDNEEILEIEEEKVEGSGLPFLLPLPPPILQNGYSQYEGNDQDVDIDGTDDEMVQVDIV